MSPPPKASLAHAVVARGRFTVSAVCEVLGAARSNVSERANRKGGGGTVRRGRPPAPDADLVARTPAVSGELPTFGSRRVHAILRRHARAGGLTAPNHRRVYRFMRERGLLLQRHSGKDEARRHDGRVAVDHSNLRWCSDGFETGCDDGRKARFGSLSNPWRSTLTLRSRLLRPRSSGLHRDDGRHQGGRCVESELEFPRFRGQLTVSGS